MRLPRHHPIALSLLLAGLTVSCGSDDIVVATTGLLEITTVTGGADLDPDGYVVQAGEAAPQAIGLDATLEEIELNPGIYAVLLGGMADNCDVVGENPRDVRITAGETSTVTFQVSCVPLQGALRRR